MRNLVLSHGKKEKALHTSTWKSLCKQRRPKTPQNNVYVSCLVINPSLDKTLRVPIKRFALQNGGKSLPLLGLSWWLEKKGHKKVLLELETCSSWRKIFLYCWPISSLMFVCLRFFHWCHVAVSKVPSLLPVVGSPWDTVLDFKTFLNSRQGILPSSLFGIRNSVILID